MSDFVEKPLLKKLNKRNPMSRIEKMERQGSTSPSPSARVFSSDEMTGGELGSSYLIAGPYPSDAYLRWYASDLPVIVGEISGDHSIGTTPTSSGLRIIGQAKQSGEIGIVYLIANDETGAAAGSFLSVRSNGDFFIGTDGAGTGTAKDVEFQIGTTATNTVQEALTLSLNTTGTAAAGFGTGLGLWAESAGGTLRKIAGFLSKLTDATDAAEYSKAYFSTIVAGAQVEKAFSGVVYASGARVNISQVGANTTIFSVTVPAYFFATGFLRFSCSAYVDQNASNRTLTSILNCGASNATAAIGGGGANVISVYSFSGKIGKGGTDVQDMFLWSKRTTINSTTTTEDADYTAAAGTESGTITVSFTLSLSGTADAAWADNIVVEAFDNGNTW